MVKKVLKKFEIRKKCDAYLGKAGRYWFLEFLALSQPRTLAKVSGLYASLPKRGASELVVWTKALLPVWQPAGTRATGGDSGLKALVSNWQEIQRGHVDRKAEPSGLRFTVSCTKLIGAGEDRTWNGSLILVYERESQSLFHHIVDLGADSAIPPDLIWFVIAQAMKAVADIGLKPEITLGPRTVMFPTNMAGNKINRTFQAATMMFENAHKKQAGLNTSWKKSHEAHFDTNLWVLKTYIGRAHLPIKVKANKVGDVAANIRRISGMVSTFIRRDMKCEIKPNSENDRAIPPSWKSLNTQRAKTRKDPHRFDQ